MIASKNRNLRNLNAKIGVTFHHERIVHFPVYLIHFLYDLCTLEKFYTTPFISLAVPTCSLTTAELIPTNSNGFPDLAAFMGMQPSSQGSKNVQDKLKAESGSSVQSKVDIDISR